MREARAGQAGADLLASVIVTPEKGAHMTRRTRRGAIGAKNDRRIIRSDRSDGDGDPVPVDEMFERPVRSRPEMMPREQDPADLIAGDPFKPYL